MIDGYDWQTIIDQFHFLRPWWLLGIIPALLLVFVLKRTRMEQSNWQHIIDKDLLPYLLEKTVGRTNLLPLWLLTFGWLTAVIALAGPTWSKNPQLVQAKEDALVIVLDLSLSMYAQDLKPSRLQKAKHKLHDLLLSREEGLTALVVYAGDSYVVSPLTDDVDTIDAMIPALNPSIMPAYGSNLEQAITDANQLLIDGNIGNGRILVITDGINTSQTNAIINAMDPRFIISVLGVGTLAGAPIPTNDGSYLKDKNGVIIIPKLTRNLLTNISNQSGGYYAEISITDSDLDYLLAPIENDLENTREIERDFDTWQEQGPLLVLLLLPIAAFAFRRGWIMQVFLAVGISTHSYQAQAISWDDLWLTKNQQGAKAREQGDNQAAAQLFESSDWKGTALYDSGDYENAVKEFSKVGGIEAVYNKGNALARAGELQKAIDSYKQVLETKPDHEDALFNKELVEKLLEQQQQQQEQQQQQQNQEGDEQQDQQNGSGQENQGEDQQDQNSGSQGEDQANQEEQQGQQQEDESQSEQQEAEQENQGETGESSEQAANENAQLSPEEQLDQEQKQAMEQWLRRVPDDPGGLLRRKFKYQYEQRRRPKQQQGQPIW